MIGRRVLIGAAALVAVGAVGAAVALRSDEPERAAASPPRPVPAGGTLAPGRYETGVFQPGFRFRVRRGWLVKFIPRRDHILLARTGQSNDPGGLFLAFDSASSSESVEQTIARLSAVDGTRADTPVDAQIGGVSGKRIDVHGTGEITISVPGLAEHYELEATDSARIYALAVGATTVTVIVEAPTAAFERFLVTADDLLTTVRFR